MKRLTARRPSPAMAVACVALFVALGGVSYGFATGSIDSREIRNETVQTQDIRKGGVRPDDIRNDSIRTEDLRNNEVRGVDIRNSTIRGIEVAINSITGLDIDEASLATVPNAGALDGLDSTAFTRPADLGRFSFGLEAGETRLIAAHGQVSAFAQCVDGGTDEVRIFAATTGSETLLDGEDNYLTEAAPLPPGTLPAAAELVAESRTPGSGVTEVEEANGSGFVIGSDGKALHLEAGSTVLGYDVAGSKCFVAGELYKTG